MAAAYRVICSYESRVKGNQAEGKIWLILRGCTYNPDHRSALKVLVETAVSHYCGKGFSYLLPLQFSKQVRVCCRQFSSQQHHNYLAPGKRPQCVFCHPTIEHHSFFLCSIITPAVTCLHFTGSARLVPQWQIAQSCISHQHGLKPAQPPSSLAICFLESSHVRKQILTESCNLG